MCSPCHYTAFPPEQLYLCHCLLIPVQGRWSKLEANNSDIKKFSQFSTPLTSASALHYHQCYSGVTTQSYAIHLYVEDIQSRPFFCNHFVSCKILFPSADWYKSVKARSTQQYMRAEQSNGQELYSGFDPKSTEVRMSETWTSNLLLSLEPQLMLSAVEVLRAASIALQSQMDWTPEITELQWMKITELIRTQQLSPMLPMSH